MRLASVLLADYAADREGLLYVIGGGIDRLQADGFPVPLQMYLGAVIELEPKDYSADLRYKVPVDISVTQEGGRKVARIRGDLAGGLRDPTRLVRVPLTLNLRGVTIPEPGTYVITVRAGKSRQAIPIEVLEIEAPSP